MLFALPFYIVFQRTAFLLANCRIFVGVTLGILSPECYTQQEYDTERGNT